MSHLSPAELAEDALANLPDGVLLVDRAGTVARLNARAEALLACRAADWVGRPAADFYAALARRSRAGESLVGEFLARAAQGQAHQAGRGPVTTMQDAQPAGLAPQLEFAMDGPNERVVEAVWFPLDAGSGERPSYGVVWRDVTQAKELEQMKNQLLSTVSHELRTPLSSIKGFASTLLRQDVRWDEASQREFLRIIEEESDRLEELIDNLLDMSQLEAGALRVQKEPVQLRRLVRDALDEAGRRTTAHWFVMDLPAAVPRVLADPRRIRQVLDNLLENAIKYSPQGGQITVTCEVEHGGVIVSVADQGPGIAPELLERVFDRFFQVNGASTRQSGGSGLGLAIARGIVEAHGGRIWAESSPGHGSVFRFTLPLVQDVDGRGEAFSTTRGAGEADVP